MTLEEVKSRLLVGLTDDQKAAVQCQDRQLLVVAGAGAGKTEVMARRIAWWITVENISRESIVALTFTEKAAAEMKFRVREKLQEVTNPGEEVRLGSMYVGTIHGFCLAKLREYWPDVYHNYDILDESARTALILREFHGTLALQKLQNLMGATQSSTVDRFVAGYDQLNEHNVLRVALPPTLPPYHLGEEERTWCSQATLETDVGSDPVSQAFSVSVARYYAYLRCRRFLDFSTSQTEFLRNFRCDARIPTQPLVQGNMHVVVDEAQDVNPVQRDIVAVLVGASGALTVVGDHRQSIYGFRGSKVQIIADLWEEFRNAADGRTVDLRDNFRSTPRIIEIANAWAKTITPLGTMVTPDMRHAKTDRNDVDPSHVASVGFSTRNEEAKWISDAIRVLVPSDTEGAEHDQRSGAIRGLSLADIGILVRSATDVRTYMGALEQRGIPAVVRAGPDLFSQPEVLLFISLIAITAGIDLFYGSPKNSRTLPGRISNVLGCPPNPNDVVQSAAQMLRDSGLALSPAVENRVIGAARAIHDRMVGEQILQPQVTNKFRTEGLRAFLSNKNALRRVFPQTIFHWLLSEGEVELWDNGNVRGETALFHLGALSGLVTGMEMPGWTSVSDYKWQVVGLCHYGSEDGRTPEQPLIVSPDAVTISTIHAVKGLEFAAVFVADVCSRRFPSQFARRAESLPMSGNILRQIDVDSLSDNSNYDAERRLMYVALTRAERFLVLTHSGQQVSRFIQELNPMIRSAGGTVTTNAMDLLQRIRHAPLEYKRDIQLSTSFSDLRYYLACSHDFYLRKVLGFAPTIDQAFGYGRGLHNLMREVHSNPTFWANIARDRDRLGLELEKLVDRGLFYLRYTTGDPAENMRKKAIRLATNYVESFASELESMVFEPEKEFETVLDPGDGLGGIMISGSIDVVRHAQPPRVTLIDFKSGEPESDKHQQLDEDEMRLQLGIYAIAAKKELEYEPDLGVVRYLDVEHATDTRAQQLEVPLGEQSIKMAEDTVINAAKAIRDRVFRDKPGKPGFDGNHRCQSCDFKGFCGMEDAMKFK